VLHRPVELTQYVSIVYNERLAEHKIAASTGTVGDFPMTMLWQKTSTALTKMSLSITGRGMMLSTWELRHLNGILGGMRPEFIKDWATAHQLKWNQNFARPTRAKK
jgi:hypothetical protein